MNQEPREWKAKRVLIQDIQLPCIMIFDGSTDVAEGEVLDLIDKPAYAQLQKELEESKELLKNQALESEAVKKLVELLKQVDLIIGHSEAADRYPHFATDLHRAQSKFVKETRQALADWEKVTGKK